ncbi:MAG: hypothetical protein PW734_06885 [Verrucomicrobium sp.]|nr:hypothetical protein [Verrucomicrobium sp.]
MAAAQRHAAESDAALAAHDLAAGKQVAKVNSDLTKQAKQIAAGDAKRKHWLYFSLFGFVLAAVMAIIGPWLAAATGYGAFLSSIPILGGIIGTAERVVAAFLGFVVFSAIAGLLHLVGVL